MKVSSQKNYFNILKLKIFMKIKYKNYNLIIKKLVKNRMKNFRQKFAINFKFYQINIKKKFTRKNNKNYRIQ